MNSEFAMYITEPATTEINTLSLHDALPISPRPRHGAHAPLADHDGPTRDRGHSGAGTRVTAVAVAPPRAAGIRSEEHTSELQSHVNLVCRLLLEKIKDKS